jgi:hypothetical protein
MGDGFDPSETMLRRDGSQVLEDPAEVLNPFATTTVVVECHRCGAQAEAPDRRSTNVRYPAYSGRPVRLRVWECRRRCPDPDRTAGTGHGISSATRLR